MRVIRNNNSIFVDCDDTLVMWDNIHKLEDMSNVKEFICGEMKYQLVPHEEHIEYLKSHKQKNQGTVIVWSAGGWEWAEEVVRVLGLEAYVDAVMEKPTRYLDDLHCKEFMGERIYKDMK